MQGPSIFLNTDDEEETLELQKPTHFSLPRGMAPPSMTGPSLGSDMLINRKKVSSDVMSMSSSSSMSSSRESSEYSDDTDRGIKAPPPQVQRPMAYGLGAAAASSSSSASSSDSGSDSDDTEANAQPYGSSGNDVMASRFKAERLRLEDEIREKKEILYQMDRLEAKGYRLPRKFSMQSDLEEMRAEYHRVLREKEVDASIRFQRKMMMALVTGVEFMNTRFDPFSVKLDGWSEQVHENITDYDDIFEELHEKYKATGKKMAPELRLLMSLSGSAFMFHLTNSMFKSSQLPGIETVLRSNPELMRQFQSAAAQQMQQLNQAAAAVQQPAPMQAPSPMGGMGGPGGGLFSMMGNLFGMATPSSGPPPPPVNSRSESVPNIDSIINNIHEEISQPNFNRVETLSVSDEEITSIIEDTADMNGILMNTGDRKARRGGGRKAAGGNGARTLTL